MVWSDAFRAILQGHILNCSSPTLWSPDYVFPLSTAYISSWFKLVLEKIRRINILQIILKWGSTWWHCYQFVFVQCKRTTVCWSWLADGCWSPWVIAFLLMLPGKSSNIHGYKYSAPKVNSSGIKIAQSVWSTKHQEAWHRWQVSTTVFQIWRGYWRREKRK